MDVPEEIIQECLHSIENSLAGIMADVHDIKRHTQSIRNDTLEIDRQQERMRAAVSQSQEKLEKICKTT